VRERTDGFIGLKHPELFTGGFMSTSARNEWRDQQAALNERMRGFMENPGAQELEAVVAEMKAYADAARTGSMEIPLSWISYN
jgi:hypothetical protein